MMSDIKRRKVCGERFSAVYYLRANKDEAYARARDICFEQTVELPRRLASSGMVRAGYAGRVESFTPGKNGGYNAVISYALETAGAELTQLINLLFGNISIKPGIRLCGFDLPPLMLRRFCGPRFGRQGIRRILRVYDRPLLCTALKPMGFCAEEFADLAYQAACGGIDIIKDDHGLTNQPFASFVKRVTLCSKAVAKANRKTAKRCIYIANVTAPFDQIMPRVKFAKRASAGGIMISPGITGFDAIRVIAGDKTIGLPILSHPAFQGPYVLNPDSGIAHSVLFGRLVRLAGADATIYPNFGGRFSFTPQECREIADGTAANMGRIKPIFPCPGGGMRLDRVPELIRFYGRDVIFLIGGALFSRSERFVDKCRHFNELVRLAFSEAVKTGI